MYVSPISMRLVRGRSTPAMRAILLILVATSYQLSASSRKLNPIFLTLPSSYVLPAPSWKPEAGSRDLSLSLLVLLVRADHPHDAPAPDDLALVTNLFHRRTDLHN